MSVILPVRYQ